MAKEKKEQEWAKKIEKKFAPDHTLTPLPLSLIIPVYNCSALMITTLESIRRQNYPHLEIIVIDAGSTDRTLEIISNYSDMIARIYAVEEFNLPEMMNQGISLATGKYITFLYPGSFYISSDSLLLMSEAATQNDLPSLLYSGSIQKEIKRPAKVIQAPISSSLLAKGSIPATIVATWFCKDLFGQLGKFDTRYRERSAFDFYCRFSEHPWLHAHLVDRVLVDFDYGPFSYGKHLRIISQTYSIISHYFGFFNALKWFLKIPKSQIIKTTRL